MVTHQYNKIRSAAQPTVFMIKGEQCKSHKKRKEKVKKLLHFRLTAGYTAVKRRYFTEAGPSI